MQYILTKDMVTRMAAKDIPGIFGELVFNDKIMRERLPGGVYAALRETVTRGARLGPEAADGVAKAMMEWATEKGATHYTHWFQPMTGATAEKHDSFISPAGDGAVIMEFSGKELIRGESDASNFPSGGLRATFEARGYTVWDTTSYAFIKNGVLCIPTAFCSYGGEALDQKTPLLRSMEAINVQALRILRLFGNMAARRVVTTVGAEQEYFLVDKKVFYKRPDLIYTGRTLFGARPPKGQELGDHYYGSINSRVFAFMNDLDEELWKLGVYAKTEHNETAPGQHEFVSVFTTANIATDHNQLTMELMKSVADRHGMVCLLHEKPFAGVNGGGKHINWSLATDSGVNLLEPGETPYENAQFLLFLVAVIKAVDEYQDILRASVAGAGNDHRLGAHEAPPSIVSMYLGDELKAVLGALEADADYQNNVERQMEIGVTVLPRFPRDSTDRNRTSPFAFTGNKFEFRMAGAPISIAGPNIILNTAAAEALKQFADILEKSADFKSELASLIKYTYHTHKRIIYNGNNYSGEWEAEAGRRGLSDLKSTADALPAYIDKKNMDALIMHGVYTESELRSRYEILLESYCKTINIEALTMTDIIREQIIPACIGYQNELAELLERKISIGGAAGNGSISSAAGNGSIGGAAGNGSGGGAAGNGSGGGVINCVFDISVERCLLEKIASLTSAALSELRSLEQALGALNNDKSAYENAVYMKEKILPVMSRLRLAADELETLVSKERWPLPSYAELLFSVV